MTWVLPFDFIPVHQNFMEKSYKKEHRGNLSGVMKVTIKVITPLIAVKEQSKVSLTERGNQIPGSSIKGMLRSAAEILWNGKMCVLKIEKEEQTQIPDIWRIKNSTIDRHCPVSHLFGFVSAEEDDIKEGDIEEKVPYALSSRIHFRQATLKGKLYSGKGVIKNHTLNGPRGLSVWYYKNGKQAAGRKVYLGGKISGLENKVCILSPIEEIEDQNAKNTVKKYLGSPREKPPFKGFEELFIFPGTEYTFNISFNSLIGQDLADLIRLIELKDGKYHALGKGRPLGFGRIKMTVEDIYYRNINNIYDMEIGEGANAGMRAEQSGMQKPVLLSTFSDQYWDKYKNIHIFFYKLINQSFDGIKSYGSPSLKVGPYRINNPITESEKEQVVESNDNKGSKSPSQDKNNKSKELKGKSEKHESIQVEQISNALSDLVNHFKKHRPK